MMMGMGWLTKPQRPQPPLHAIRSGVIGLIFTLAALTLAARAAAPATLDTQTAIAQSELSTLADALEQCAAWTGYYVSLETLNDLPVNSSTPAWDAVGQGGGTWVIFPSGGLFRPSRVDLVNGAIEWGGPYVNYQSSRTQTAATPYDQGSPLDPWGTPYYFFSPLGLIRGDTGQVTLELYGDQFDRYTLVSLGSDLVQSSDDIIWPFGGGVSDLVLSSVRTVSGGAGLRAAAAPALPGARPRVGFDTAASTVTVPAGSTLAIRGQNLGATASGAQVLFGAQVLASTTWSASEIRLTLPMDLSGAAALTVQRGSVKSNALKLAITPAPENAAREWTAYR